MVKNYSTVLYSLTICSFLCISASLFSCARDLTGSTLTSIEQPTCELNLT